MQIISDLIDLTKEINLPIFSTDNVGLLAYPFERWIVTSLVLSLIAAFIPS